MDDGFEGFGQTRVALPTGVALQVRHGGTRGAPPLLLVHGYPQTGAMWRRVAQALAPRFELVIPDLRGYGASDKPATTPDHAPYAKRAMAADLHALMRHLGHERYAVAGHDRGGRAAHRLALDQPQAVTHLAVLDIVPTLDMYERTDMRFASAYYHWFFLIQPHPHPEHLIGGDPLHYLRWKLGGWGSGGRDFIEPAARAAYERAFADPATIHATCEDYRAGASIDLVHDRASRAEGRRIQCPLLVLWGSRGVVAALYDPPALWQPQCAQPVQALALDAGHFLAEEQPEATAEALRGFLADAN